MVKEFVPNSHNEWTWHLIKGVVVFGQQVVDPISGGAGWVGAGLLGLVLAWLLLKHLPDKDKQIGDLIKQKDTQIKDILENKDRLTETITNQFRAETKDTRDEFKATLTVIITHCEREMTKVADAIRTDLKMWSGRSGESKFKSSTSVAEHKTQNPSDSNQ